MTVDPSGRHNSGSDPVSRDVYDLILAGLTNGQTGTWWLPYTMRLHLARAVFDELVAAGVQVRVEPDPWEASEAGGGSGPRHRRQDISPTTSVRQTNVNDRQA